MAKQVRASYDFNAEPRSGELSIRENEILTVIRENIEGGWIEGKNSKGEVGLFPESYVTRMVSFLEGILTEFSTLSLFSKLCKSLTFCID